MWPRNAMFYQITEQKALPTHEDLMSFQFTPPASLEWTRSGWVPPQVSDDSLVYPLAPLTYLTLRTEDKVLPANVVNRHVAAYVHEIETEEKRSVGRKERLSIKERIIDDLLPRAFTRARNVNAYFHGSRLVLDTVVTSHTEALLPHVRGVLARPPRCVAQPSLMMTAWLADGTAPDGFKLADSAVLESPSDGAKVKLSGVDLTCEEVRNHIAAGKQVTELGLTYADRVRFVVTDDLRLKRIEWLDVLQEEAAGDHDATRLIVADQLQQIFDALVAAFGGYAE